MRYLAIPYSGQEELSYETSLKICAHWMKKGILVFSPVIHNHPLDSLVQGSHEFWMILDFWFLDRCNEVIVVMNPDYLQSKGVTAEIQRAILKGIPVRYFTAKEILNEIRDQ